MKESALKKTIKAWATLLRLPNLFTVPGDAAAGFLLAGATFSFRLAPVCIAVIGLYCAGLVLNDWFDIEEDRRERPERPLPSGRINPSAAFTVGIILLVLPNMLLLLFYENSATLAGLILALLVLSYNGLFRSIPLLRFTLMGLCRAGSVWLGAVCATESLFPFANQSATIAGLLILAIATALVYTMAISVVAFGETRNTAPSAALYAPACVPLAASMATITLWPVAGCVLMAGAAEAGFWVHRARRHRLPIPRLVGRLILIMLTTQAAWVVLGLIQQNQWNEAIGAIIAFILLRFGAEIATRRFYGS